MEKNISGYSVDENLTTGAEFYGSLGRLIGVVEFEDGNVTFIINKQGEYVCRETIIDVSVSMTKKGPSVSEKIFMSSIEKQLDKKEISLLHDSIFKTGNLDLLGNGVVDIKLGLQQLDNSIFVPDEELFNYFKNCKEMYPELPLNYAIKMIPYEKTTPKIM